MYHNKKIKGALYNLIGVCCALIIIGLLFIYSSSSIFSVELFGTSAYFIKKQLIGLFIGCCCFYAIHIISLDFIYSITPFAFICTLLLTLLTLVKPFGVSVHGSSRWLNFYFLTFQPSELLKISLVLYIARFIADREKQSFSFLTLTNLFNIPKVLSVLILGSNF